jgi:hypothetical protein
MKHLEIIYILKDSQKKLLQTELQMLMLPDFKDYYKVRVQKYYLIQLLRNMQ